MRSAFVLSALAAVLPALAAPTVAPFTKRGVDNTYLIKIKDDVPQSDFVSSLKSGLTHPDSAIIYKYSVINGVAVTLGPEDLTYVRSMKGIEYMENDQVMSLSVDRTLERRDPVPNNEGDSCPKRSFAEDGGKGVTIYGLDTGVNVNHECFGGRASWSGVFGAEQVKEDLHGHGTHTAGTAVCTQFGVARQANFKAVKVLGATGAGQNSDVIAGVDHVCKEFVELGKPPSIVTMSLGGGPSQILDDAITKCANDGMHFTVAAGNDNKDAKDYSPARVEIANTVGAVDDKCAKASFSNFGSVLDVHAPGVGIVSASNLDNKGTKQMSGTSMSTPYVAGVLAVALGKDEYSKLSPQALTAVMKANAYHGATGFPPDTTTDVARIW